MITEPNPNLLTVKEVSLYLRLPLPTVYYLVKHEKLPALKIGGRYRIRKDVLDRDILKMETVPQ